MYVLGMYIYRKTSEGLAPYTGMSALWGTVEYHRCLTLWLLYSILRVHYCCIVYTRTMHACLFVGRRPLLLVCGVTSNHTTTIRSRPSRAAVSYRVSRADRLLKG